MDLRLYRVVALGTTRHVVRCFQGVILYNFLQVTAQLLLVLSVTCYLIPVHFTIRSVL